MIMELIIFILLLLNYLHKRHFFIEFKIRVLALLKRKKLINCGVSRSRSEFKNLISKYYKISTFDNYKSFILTKK